MILQLNLRGLTLHPLSPLLFSNSFYLLLSFCLSLIYSLTLSRQAQHTSIRVDVGKEKNEPPTVCVYMCNVRKKEVGLASLSRFILFSTHLCHIILLAQHFAPLLNVNQNLSCFIIPSFMFIFSFDIRRILKNIIHGRSYMGSQMQWSLGQLHGYALYANTNKCGWVIHLRLLFLNECGAPFLKIYTKDTPFSAAMMVCF